MTIVIAEENVSTEGMRRKGSSRSSLSPEEARGVSRSIAGKVEIMTAGGERGEDGVGSIHGTCRIIG